MPGLSSFLPFSPNTSPRLSPELLSSPEHHSNIRGAATPVMPLHNSAPEKVLELPAFLPATVPTFAWGSCNSTTSSMIPYIEVVHWSPNLFKVLFGKAGKSFVSELASLYKAFASSSAMESIAIKAHHCSTYSAATETFSQIKSQRTQCLPGEMLEYMAGWRFE